MNIRLIAAIDDRRGLAKNGDIPWNLPIDSRYYREKVKDSPVLMGWNTYKGMRENLAGAHQFVVTSEHRKNTETTTFISTLDSFFTKLPINIWVLGGGSIFAQTLQFATELYLTRVEGDYDCDIFFPEFEDKFMLEIQTKTQTENNINFRFEVWKKRG